MIERYFNWLKRRKKARDLHAFEAGFGWAMTQFYFHGQTKSQIEGKIDPLWGEPFSEFDHGALIALRIIFP